MGTIFRPYRTVVQHYASYLHFDYLGIYHAYKHYSSKELLRWTFYGVRQ